MRLIKGSLAGLVLVGILAMMPAAAFAHGGGGHGFGRGGGGHAFVDGGGHRFSMGEGRFGGRDFGRFHRDRFVDRGDRFFDHRDRFFDRDDRFFRNRFLFDINFGGLGYPYPYWYPGYPYCYY
jgi:hypothetical protein